MIIKWTFYVVTIFVLAGIANPLVQTSYGQQQQSSFPSRNTVYAPFASLQYGPKIGESITLFYRAAEFLNGKNNTILLFYNPSTTMDNITTAFENSDILYSNDTIKPVFDSYFAFNRLSNQIVPKISNTSVSISNISNPDAAYITRAKLSNPMVLPSAHSGGSLTSFMIPRSIKNGFYLVTLSVYLPDYKIRAVYSNSALIHDTIRKPTADSFLNFLITNKLGNTTSSFGSGNTTSSFGSGNTTSSFGSGNTTSSFGSGNTTSSFGSGNTTSNASPNPVYRKSSESRVV
jgi:hypothetical protein